MKNPKWVVPVILVTMVVSSCSGAHAMQQASPPAPQLAESDALWGGSFVESLPDCESAELCMATLTQSERVDNLGWHTYRLEVTGDQARFLVDSTLLLDVTDNRLISSSAGEQVSLSVGEMQVNVRSIKVIAL